ncbi:MAG: hypothetical protein HQK49_16005 [Oligoflexia bacterium]|nr:hypothetical protein [Oligoflexia bacterium]
MKKLHSAVNILVITVIIGSTFFIYKYIYKHKNNSDDSNNSNLNLSLKQIPIKDIKDKGLTKDNSNSLLNNLKLVPPAFEYSHSQIITFGNKTFEVVYTVDSQLTNYINNLLLKFHPDYSAVVVIDNNTGKIISATGFQKDGNKIVPSLAFSNTNPCASLFKIVTAAALIQDCRVDPETMFTYLGRSTTLYRYQLKMKNNRAGRPQSLKKAFATSNNVIFGKAVLQYCNKKELDGMAYKFGFNQNLMDEIGLSPSIVDISNSSQNNSLNNYDDQVELASFASGFNTQTLISPVHAALLSSVLANDGILIYPTIISKVIDKESSINIWEKIPTETRVVNVDVARKLKEMMGLTIKEGTARKSFRRLRRVIDQELMIGGKSGSITGGTPQGKRNWFTAFAAPKNPSYGKGISISVMNIGVEDVSVKPAYLARSIIEFYFQNNLSNQHKVSNLHQR